VSRPTLFEPPALPTEQGRRREAAHAMDAALAATFDEARRAGYAAGRRDVDVQVAELAARNAELDRALAVVRAAQAALAGADATVLDDLVEQATAMAVELAAAIVGRELRACGDDVRDAIRRALALVPDRGSLTVRVHPADGGAAVALATGDAPDVCVVPDPAVEPGGCVVEVGALRVDAQIGPAIARLRDLLA
jgi:flagellar assembly protein FliH